MGAYRSDDTPGMYRSKSECRAYRANSVLYCTISHDAVRYYATPCYAIHTTLRRAYHAMPQCHTILHNVPPAPWCPARILRASSHAYGDSGSGSGSGVWHARLAVPAATRREPRVPPDITRSLNPLAASLEKLVAHYGYGRMGILPLLGHDTEARRVCALQRWEKQSRVGPHFPRHGKGARESESTEFYTRRLCPPRTHAR